MFRNNEIVVKSFNCINFETRPRISYVQTTKLVQVVDRKTVSLEIN